jgi:hypothetical protein
MMNQLYAPVDFDDAVAEAHATATAVSSFLLFQSGTRPTRRAPTGAAPAAPAPGTIPTALVDDLFRLRNQIYDNKELFYRVLKEPAAGADAGADDPAATAAAGTSDAADAPPPTVDPSTVAAIEQHVVKGRALLDAAIVEHNRIQDRIAELDRVRRATDRALQAARQQAEQLRGLWQDGDALLLPPPDKAPEPASDAAATPPKDDDAPPPPPPPPPPSQPPPLLADLAPFHARQDALAAAARALRQQQARVGHTLRELSTVFRVLKNTSVFYTCPICLTHTVSCFVVPCGHTLCDRCAARMERHCFMCRVEVERVQQLYFS